MLHGDDLLRWTRAEYMAWWEKRHDAHREPADELLARMYLRGAVDAMAEEVARHQKAIAVRHELEQRKAVK